MCLGPRGPVVLKSAAASRKYIDPFHRVSNDIHCMKLKLFVVRHLGAQVTIGRYGQNKAFGYYCTFTVSDYGFGFIFLQWALTSFDGKNIKVLRDPKQA